MSGHADAELNEPRDLSTQRLAEIAFECLNAHGASLRPGALRWQRNGITAVMELQRRALAAVGEE
jgi:hypothetical protein